MKDSKTIILEILIILAYYFNNTLGMVFMFGVTVWKLFFQHEKNCIRFLELMIMALPMAYIGIAGIAMHQLFSWYNVFLVFFLIVLFHYYSWKVPIHHIAASQLVLILLLLLLNLPYSDDMKKTFAEISQIFVMLIPIVMFHTVKKSLQIEKVKVRRLLYLYADVCVATSIAMILQYMLYHFVHMQVGIIEFYGGGRVSCQCLFKGASILPVFIGVGMVILFMDMLDARITIANISKMIVIFFAVVLNSSRTALFMLIVVLAFVCLKQLLRRPGLKPLLIALVGFVAALGGVHYIISLRKGLSSFLDANGRIETWMDGIDIWLANIKNFFIGGGFSGGFWIGAMKPHNFPIQTLAQCGLIISLVIFSMIFVYLWHNRKNRYKYAVWFTLLSGFLVTDFYANAFTTVIFILVDLYGALKTDEIVSI